MDEFSIDTSWLPEIQKLRRSQVNAPEEWVSNTNDVFLYFMKAYGFHEYEDVSSNELPLLEG